MLDGLIRMISASIDVALVKFANGRSYLAGIPVRRNGLVECNDCERTVHGKQPIDIILELGGRDAAVIAAFRSGRQ